VATDFDAIDLINCGQAIGSEFRIAIQGIVIQRHPLDCAIRPIFPFPMFYMHHTNLARLAIYV
jgi:hypothetical protein